MRLRQILDEYYSNERLKAIGRDAVETPIRRVQREAISEELVPLKNRVAEIEKGVQATRSIAEDVLGRLAQISLGVGAVSPEINGDYIQRLELAVSQLTSYPIRLSDGDDGAVGSDKGHVLLNAELVRKLDEVKAFTAKLVLRALRNTIRAAVQAKLKTGHILRVQLDPETGVEVYAEFEVVEKVSNPETEITLNDARRLCEPTAQLGSKVWRRIHSDVDAVRVIAQAANEFIRRE